MQQAAWGRQCRARAKWLGSTFYIHNLIMGRGHLKFDIIDLGKYGTLSVENGMHTTNKKKNKKSQVINLGQMVRFKSLFQLNRNISRVGKPTTLKPTAKLQQAQIGELKGQN